MNGMNLN